VIYQTQKGFFNFCAPANLFMALTYWGWRGDVNEIGAYLKPFNEDKNVMPYEMANYVQEKTDFEIITRYGGTIDLVKQLIAAGYPVLIEKAPTAVISLARSAGWGTTMSLPVMMMPSRFSSPRFPAIPGLQDLIRPDHQRMARV